MTSTSHRPPLSPAHHSQTALIDHCLESVPLDPHRCMDMEFSCTYLLTYACGGVVVPELDPTTFPLIRRFSILYHVRGSVGTL